MKRLNDDESSFLITFFGRSERVFAVVVVVVLPLVLGRLDSFKIVTHGDAAREKERERESCKSSIGIRLMDGDESSCTEPS